MSNIDKARMEGESKIGQIIATHTLNGAAERLYKIWSEQVDRLASENAELKKRVRSLEDAGHMTDADMRREYESQKQYEKDNGEF